jgi:hypothetical protein
MVAKIAAAYGKSIAPACLLLRARERPQVPEGIIVFGLLVLLYVKWACMSLPAASGTVDVFPAACSGPGGGGDGGPIPMGGEQVPPGCTRLAAGSSQVPGPARRPPAHLPHHHTPNPRCAGADLTRWLQRCTCDAAKNYQRRGGPACTDQALSPLRFYLRDDAAAGNSAGGVSAATLAGWVKVPHDAHHPVALTTMGRC